MKKSNFIKNFSLFGILSLTLTVGFSACGGDDDEPMIPQLPEQPDTPDPIDPDEQFDKTFESKGFAHGADISWVTELESQGFKFYPQTGDKAKELTKLLRNNCGVNAIRLRVWVNPTNGWNGLQDVLEKARRAKELRMRVMIDFHFSDTWADPGHQQSPAAWAGYTPEQTATAIAKHVDEVLTALHTEGVDVTWVQIGNETSTGMLHNLRGEMNGTNAGEFPRYLNAGYDAVKAVYPSAQVIVHLNNGHDKAMYKWFFNLLNAHNGKYDMIGMSLYPEIETGLGSSWKVTLDNTAITNCIENIKEVNQTYGKKIMLCEIGFHYSNEKGAKQTIQKFIDEFATGSVLDGIFYWEPEAPEIGGPGYTKGAFKNNRPTTALDPFRKAVLTPAS